MVNTSIYLTIKKSALRFLPIILILAGLLSFYYFDLYHYLSFATLKENHQLLQSWTKVHFLQMSLFFIILYVISTAISIPGSLILTLTGGFLFGLWIGTLYVVFSATMGAALVYLAMRYAFSDWMTSQLGGKLKLMQEGFKKNAFAYLFAIRLIPIFPFWLVNIVPALLNIPFSSYFFATLLGIIPGSLIYVALGNSLNELFAQDKTPNFDIIFRPSVFLPLLGLAILSLLPIVYKRFKKRKHEFSESATNQDSFD